MDKLRKSAATVMTFLLSIALHAVIIGGVMYASGAFTKQSKEKNAELKTSRLDKYSLLPDVEVISDISAFKHKNEKEPDNIKKEDFGESEAQNAADGESDRNALAYNDGVVSRMQRARLYPDEAVKEGIQGTTEVSIMIMPDGSVGKVTVLKSSGREILDREAVATVNRASPFPPYDGIITREKFFVHMAVTFKLK